MGAGMVAQAAAATATAMLNDIAVTALGSLVSTDVKQFTAHILG